MWSVFVFNITKSALSLGFLTYFGRFSGDFAQLVLF